MVMSKNWLTNVSGGKIAVPGAKTQLAARQDDFARKVQAMRVATGKIESRRVYFRCARTSGGFYADFERTTPAEPFRIARIEREAAAGTAAAGTGGGIKAARSSTAFDYREFDTSGWYCPWCDIRGGFVHCHDCGENVCKARTAKRPDGTDWFTCTPVCGSTGTLAPADKIHGTAPPRHGLLGHRSGSTPALPKNTGPARLPPASGAPRLSGPGR